MSKSPALTYRNFKRAVDGLDDRWRESWRTKLLLWPSGYYCFTWYGEDVPEKWVRRALGVK